MGAPPCQETSTHVPLVTRAVQRFRQVWRRGLQPLIPAGSCVVVVASITTSCVVLGVRQIGGLQPAELAAFDQMVRLVPDRSVDDRLLLVEITEADIRAQNRFPLTDQVVAQALQNLQRYQPQTIGVDLFRDIPHEPGSKALETQLRQPNVVAVTYAGNATEETIPAPSYLPDDQIGFNDLVTDPDGVVRRNLMFVSSGERTLRSFAVQLAFLYLAARKTSVSLTEAGEIQLDQTVFTKLEPNSGGYQAIDAEGYQILLNYRSATDSIRRVTLQQVLDRQIDPNWVRGKVVLIGATAPSAKDLFYTPYSPATTGNRQMPGVIIHAQAVSQIISAVLDRQPLFWFCSDRLESVWIIGWAVVGSWATWRIRRWRLLACSGAVSLGILFGLGFGIFMLAGWVPLVAPALALILAGASVFTYRVLHNAFHDPLTDLPNRALFLRRLQAAIRHQARVLPSQPSTQFAVLFLDLDRFKVVNDNLGHHVGDQLLIRSSQRLQTCLRRQDVLARVGGDEFAILLRNLNHLDQATDLADQLQQQMALPFRVHEQQIFTSISIGIALNREGYDYKPEDLLRDAHTAMYRAKASGKARHEVFATGMRMQVVRRLQLETDLRQAIEHQEFQLHYQPIVALKTGQTAGFEALVRWQHAERGFISPTEFIPVAEETGLIIPLGQWILQTACRQLKAWQTQFASESLTVSVNLSGHQFTQPDLVEYIEATLATIGLEGRSLKLEITESVAMNDVEAAIVMLLRLKALNLQLSIDDFGTGYSSLSYLHRFPINTLKVDRSFVSRMDNVSDDAGIVQTIVGLAHSLRMDVVAEGVETAAQLAKLQALNCEYGQGYFFAKPLPAHAVEALLAAKTRWLERQ